MSETFDDRQRRDFEDQQNELAGRDTGRMARFGVGAARELEVKEKRRAERAYRDALDRLLANPDYRRLYEDLGRELSAAEIDADTAIAAIEEQMRLVERHIDAMESTAARGPDGRPVFRYADGRVVYADRSEVPVEIAEGIIWPENAPSAEDYFAAQEHRLNLQSLLGEWQTCRQGLGGIRHQYDDRENPFADAGALNESLEWIETMRPSLQTIEAPEPNEVVPTATPASDLTLPSQLR